MTKKQLLQVIKEAAKDRRPSLDLSKQGLTALPPEIGQLTNLQELDLENNQLSALPPEIGQLTSLQELNLDSNQLRALPPEIGQLTSLQELKLHGNQLRALPPEIGHLSSLESLDVDDNPLNEPPVEVIQQGTKAVLAYLRARFQESGKQWLSKLLVVGEGGVGKTCLLRALRGEKFTPQDTTHGIEVVSLNLPHPKNAGVSMQLNGWDFGGQEIYHATFQFFLTNRSLFILAWNARHGFEQGRLYYWLDTIQARAPESPVLIVATHTDQRDADIPLAELRAKYPQVVGHYAISNRDGNGIPQLREAIAAAAADLPLMGQSWPAKWLTAADAIRARQENFISPQQLCQVMAQHNVTGEEQPVLSKWLHELGDIVYFQDDLELNDTVILDPQWVTKSISRVLESEQVIGRSGIFTRAHMEEIWRDIDPAMRGHFLCLMERFDLSYRTLQNREISIVVERLPLDPPPYEETWSETPRRSTSKEISMKFVFSSTMPAGLPTWFIARTHRFTTHTHWRLGALFADSPKRNHLALVQAFLHDRYIRLTVRGRFPHNFFALLRDGLELTIGRFPGLRVDRRIPCPGHKGSRCHYEFDLAELERAIERDPPVMEVQCRDAFQNVSVASLLFGIDWRTQGDVLLRIDNLTSLVTEQHEETLQELKDLRELTQREFLNVFRREQANVDLHCPNVFVLRPKGPKTRTAEWWAKFAGQKLELQLFCQAPGRWHPTSEVGRYVIEKPAAWLQTVAPYIGHLVSVLKYAAPLVAPSLALPKSGYEKLFRNDITFMNELVKKLPEIKDPEKLGVGELLGEKQVGGATLRGLRHLLDDLDPAQHWGGLRIVPTPEGHHLWLCEQHAAEYKV